MNFGTWFKRTKRTTMRFEADGGQVEVEQEMAVEMPACVHPPELRRELAGVGVRCNGCGVVSTAHGQSVGVSREELPQFEGTRTNFAPRGFQTARARMRMR